MNKIILPAALWNLRQAFKLHGFDIRPVGGCVRDTLCGIVPKDLDLCTDASPLEQKRIYEDGNFRYIETGLSHGTLTVVLDDVPYEITSLRTETDHDGRWANVSYTKDWIGDLARRDLTINAMSMTFEGDLIDPFDGKADLDNGVIRFVGNAAERIREDYLRILRYFRFFGRFGDLDHMGQTNGYKAIRLNAEGLKKISRERVWSEVSKIIVGPQGIDMMLAMVDVGLAPYIDLPVRRGYVRRLRDIQRADPVSMLAKFVGNRGDMVQLAIDWKMSTAERDQALYITQMMGEYGDVGATIPDVKYQIAFQKVNKHWLVQYLLVMNRPEDAALIDAWNVPTFPVTGADLIARDIPPGRWMGQLLEGLRSQWAMSNYEATKEMLLKNFKA